MIRHYKISDKNDLVEIFKLNTPKFFDVNELNDYVNYLENNAQTYLTVILDNKIVGGTGYYINEEDNIGQITWIFFHPEYAGNGLGKLTVNHCLELFKKNKYINKVKVTTSQLAFQFFEKFGFEIVKIEKDYWAKGLDLFLMEYQLFKNVTSSEIRKLSINEKLPYNLLLLADETLEAINKYIHQAEIYVIEQDNEIIASYALLKLSKYEIEIKNIAVKKMEQGKGIGSFLLNDAVQKAKKQGYKTLIIGTADVALQQIAFYKKNGFEKYAIKKDFYLNNYSEPIFENGKQLKNMILLKKEF